MEALILDNPFLLLGLFLVFGYILSLLLQKINIPPVITYLLSGFLLANTLYKDVNLLHKMESWFDISENLALGLIGFKIGTELKGRLLIKNRKFILKTLFFEVFLTLFSVTLLIFIFTQNFLMAIILGGLATATAPAATIEVLRKLKAKGTLTQRIQWILAFDDVLAVVIVEAIFVYILVSTGGAFTIVSFFTNLFREVGLSLILGVAIGFILDNIVERMKDDLEMMELTLAVLIMAVGIATLTGTSVILTTMTIGATSTNRGGDNYEKVQDLLEYIMSPIVMIFFVLVGARLLIIDLFPFPWLALIYLVARSAGKIFGAYFGSKSVCENKAVQKNLGFGLLSQGGVALGLVSIAASILTDIGQSELGHQIISIIIISTIISEGLGAITTEYAVKKVGEDGKLNTKQELFQKTNSHFHPGMQALIGVMYEDHLENCPENCEICEIQNLSDPIKQIIEDSKTS